MLRLRAWVSMVLAASVAFVATADAEAAPRKKKRSAPAETKTESTVAADFDKAAAITAIAEVNLSKCKVTNAARGEGHVTITFAPSGTAQSVTVDKGPWVGTPVAKCMVKEFKKAKVPAFRGEAVTVGKVFHFE